MRQLLPIYQLPIYQINRGGRVMKRLLQAAFALITLALLATGCGGSTPAPTAIPTATATATPSPTATPTATPQPSGPQVITLAGSEEGFADGAGSAAQFSGAVAVTVDVEGNVYVADSANHRVRKIAPDGTVTTAAGSDEDDYLDGPVSEALFQTPTGVAMSASGTLYVADSWQHDPHPMRIRAITPEGMVVTLAGSSEAGSSDGIGVEATFRSPVGITTDNAGNVIVADTKNHRIRRVTPAGEVTTLAGPTGSGYAAGYADGPAAEARFQEPRNVAVDGAGTIYVADTGNHCIRKITPDGTVTTLAGTNEPGYADGPGTQARFSYPAGIAVDGEGNLYVADTANHRIRQITPDGTVTTLAGAGGPGNADGPAAEAQFRSPEGIAVDASGNIIVADTGNHRIRKIVTN
jgi:sugar lactone lactonase YvrE